MFPAKVSTLLRLISLTACLLFGTAFAASWTASVDDRQGLPILSKGGASALASTFVFWEKNWKFSRLQTELNIAGPFEYAVIGTNKGLDFDLKAQIRKPSARQLVWEFDLDSRGTATDAIGGGISFKFDLATFGSELGDPELLPGNRGWTWGLAGRSRVEMRFDPPLPLVYFERGRKSEIRAFFYKDAVPRGRRRHVATLTVSEDVSIVPTLTERYGPVNLAAWPSDILDGNTSPVDLSFLNSPEKPAGKRGFLKVIKDQFVFEDGTVARFWGTNLTARALFRTTPENVKRQARRLSELGFNLVRLHHHDSAFVDPNIFGNRNVLDTRTLDAAMLGKLDWWIKCLKDEGIYIWLDLHVGRRLMPGDGIDGFHEINRDKFGADLRGYNYVNTSIQEAMKRFNAAYVTHRNTYTGLRYADDPAIVALLLTNENDITNHFGNRLLPDKNVPKHNALYMAQAKAFASIHRLPKDKVWRSWEHGPSKLFLNDLEHRFNDNIIKHLRSLGIRTSIATTSTWGNNPLSSLPALMAGNIIDAHSYGGTGELEKNPIYTPNLMHWFAAAHVAGRPLSVTEWNVSPFPVPDRHTTPLYMAASARLQGWNALMQYAYSQDPFHFPGKPSNWHSYNDPALLSTLPAAALLYRQGHAQEASTVYAFAPSKEQLFGQSISPRNAIALRTVVEMAKLVIALPQTPELPWLEKSAIPIGAKVITDPNQSFLNAAASEIVSETGELRRNWDLGVYTINTPRTQAAMGWIGGKKISLPDVGINVTTRNATVAIQSLDGNSIGNASALLISLGARSVPVSTSQLPFHSEPVEGMLTIRARKGLKLYKSRSPGAGKVNLAAPYEGGRYHITLDRGLGTYWLFLE